MTYYRPLLNTGPLRPEGALGLAGGWAWFTHIAVLQRHASAQVIAASCAPPDILRRLTTPRAPVAGLDLGRIQVMGILNATPDSFSDGGHFDTTANAVAHGQSLLEAGANILDIGGESTRPGAPEVPPEEECARVVPVVKALKRQCNAPLSIDTRKAEVARQTLSLGADLINDVSGFTFDPTLAPLCARAGVAVCVMHSQGAPGEMQNDPRYSNVLLDVYDTLDQHLTRLEQTGIARSSILLDPGIGFGKTLAHNLALLEGVSLFHSLGCGLLVGASRKSMIAYIAGGVAVDQRMPGSLALAQWSAQQGVQVVRVHDVAQTVQALAVWQALREGKENGA